MVEAVGASGSSFVVAFEGYESREEVGKDAIQLRVADGDSGYKGGSAGVAVGPGTLHDCRKACTAPRLVAGGNGRYANITLFI